MDSGGGWILEVDIRKFFDTLGHSQLRELLQLRVCDGVLKRLIGKWLKAGVMEDGNISYPEAGSPQGGVISPLLANVFLHYVLDVWFRQEVQPRMKGKSHLIRYADNFVILFTREDDARRVMEVLPKRFEKYRTDASPGKDAAGSLSTAAPWGDRQRGRPGPPAGNVRPLGFHPLLGALPAWILGGDAANGVEAFEPGGAWHRPMVPEESAPSGARAARDAESKGAWTLRVLRDYQQRACVADIPASSAARLAEVVGSPQPPMRADLGPLPSAAGALSAPAAEDCPLGVRQVANP